MRTVAIVGLGLLLAACGGLSAGTDASDVDVFTPVDAENDVNAALDVVSDVSAALDAPGDGTCGVATGVCDPVSGAGCGANETCAVRTASDGGVDIACVVSAQHSSGEACVDSASCARGLLCVDNVCTAMCCGAGDDARCQSTADSCSHYIGCSTRLQGVSFWLCTRESQCDPLRQDCPSGSNCVPDGTGLASCVPAGAGRGGDPCGSVGACAVGLACVGATNATCRAICAVGGDAGSVCGGTLAGPCPSGQTCGVVATWGPNVGVCTP